MGGCNLGNQADVRTVCSRPKHSARFTRGRSPDSQVIAAPAGLPIPKNSGLLRRPLAAHSGGTVRDLHPLPFSLAFDDEHLREFSSYHIDPDPVNLTGPIISDSGRRARADAARGHAIIIKRRE
jgi:hypothetical protein